MNNSLLKPFNAIFVDSEMDYLGSQDRWIKIVERVKALPFLKSPICEDLTVSQITLISCVAHRPGSGILEVASQLGLTPPTVSVGIRSLIGRGWLWREANRYDRRAVRLYLTPKSKSLLERVHQHSLEVMEKFLGGLTLDERERLLSLMEHAVTTAEQSSSL